MVRQIVGAFEFEVVVQFNDVVVVFLRISINNEEIQRFENR